MHFRSTGRSEAHSRTRAASCGLIIQEFGDCTIWFGILVQGRGLTEGTDEIVWFHLVQRSGEEGAGKKTKTHPGGDGCGC